MEKDFDQWNQVKKLINENDHQKFVNEREIWWCSIGLNVGDEQDGKNDSFERPVLVLKKFNRHIVLTLPLTTKVKANRYYFSFTHDTVAFAVILSQIRLLSTKRFTRRIRKIPVDIFEQIKKQMTEVSL